MVDLDFENYRYEQRLVSPCHARKNFYKVLRDLGASEPKEKLMFLTIKLKNASEIQDCNRVCNGFEFKISKRFLGRRVSPSNRLTFISAIEPDRKNDNREYHIHGLLKLGPIQSKFIDQEIEMEVRKVLRSLDEVNGKSPRMVMVRTFPFSGLTSDLGNTIQYMVKESCSTYDPLLRFNPNKKRKTLCPKRKSTSVSPRMTKTSTTP